MKIKGWNIEHKINHAKCYIYNTQSIDLIIKPTKYGDYELWISDISLFWLDNIRCEYF